MSESRARQRAAQATEIANPETKTDHLCAPRVAAAQPSAHEALGAGPPSGEAAVGANLPLPAKCTQREACAVAPFDLMPLI